MNTATSPKWWWIIDGIILALLTLIFGFFYITSHAWGSWGDDAPGYLYTAGQWWADEPLVSQDSLVQRALTYFGDEKFARFVAPTHHEIISSTGWIASRYPIGLGWLLYSVAKISGSDEAWYDVEPGLAVGVVLLTYLLALRLFQLPPALQRASAVMAALSLGLASLYANYAVAQPMREIPALFFFMLALWLILLLPVTKRWWCQLGLWLGAGASYGMSVNIRETSGILLGVFIVLGWQWWRQWNTAQRYQVVGVFLIGAVCVGSLSLWNSVNITLHKEKFRDKDISRIAITSNFDHVRSLQLQNLYNNQGKFRPGVGGLKQYWEVLTAVSTWPLFLLAAAVGLILLWRAQKSTAVMLLVWFGPLFLLFSAWINPYPRYLIPAVPVITLLAAYGSVTGVLWLQQKLQLQRWSWTALVMVFIGSFFVSLQPSIAERQRHNREADPVYKAITRDDLHQLKAMAEQLPNNALLLMVGDWQAGISETIMTHSAARVIRFPRKPKEKPPVNQVYSFLRELTTDYQLYLWYDGSANADEQRLLNIAQLEPVATYNFSFQSNVQLYLVDSI